MSGFSRTQTASGSAFGAENLGLEHLDIVVPDTAAAARFYARVFKSPLHEQPVRDTLRYFVVLGDVPADRQVGYIAIGAGGTRPPAIGHYCLLAKVYDRAGMVSAMQTAGFGVAAAGPQVCGPIRTVSSCNCFSRPQVSSPQQCPPRFLRPATA